MHVVVGAAFSTVVPSARVTTVAGVGAHARTDADGPATMCAAKTCRPTAFKSRRPYRLPAASSVVERVRCGGP